MQKLFLQALTSFIGGRLLKLAAGGPPPAARTAARRGGGEAPVILVSCICICSCCYYFLSCMSLSFKLVLTRFVCMCLLFVIHLLLNLFL